jgi:hypothetical protein
LFWQKWHFGVRQSLLTCLPLAQAGAGAEAKTSALQKYHNLLLTKHYADFSL